MPIVRALVAVVTVLSMLVVAGRADGSPLSRAYTTKEIDRSIAAVGGVVIVVGLPTLAYRR